MCGLSRRIVQLMTGLTRSRAQTPLRLRQQGTFHYACMSFFALRAKNDIQLEEKHRCEHQSQSTTETLLLRRRTKDERQ